MGGAEAGVVPLDEALSARIQGSKLCLTERGMLGPRPKEAEDLARSSSECRAEPEALGSPHCLLVGSV